MTTDTGRSRARAQADAVPLDSPRFHGDPEGLYRELRRRHGAVVPVTLPGGGPAWLVIGYREAHHVTSHPDVFARAVAPQAAPAPSLAGLDGAAHERRAGALAAALEPVEPLGLRRGAERIADELVDRFCAAGEAELMGDYALPLAARALVAVCGFPAAEAQVPAAALGALADGEGGFGTGGGDARTGLAAAVADLVARRRATAPPPGAGTGAGADVVSRLLADPRGLTDEEVTRDVIALCTLGHRPTADWIGNTLRLMLTDDRFSAPFSGGRHHVGDALHEVLWDDTPVPNALGRRATRATQLGGRSIAAGDLLVLGLQGANADPEVRQATSADADAAFWVMGLTGISTAGNRAYLSFGHGAHRCPFPAQEIAETIARTGVDVLLDRLPDVAPAVREGALTRRPTPWHRGLAALPVTFRPAAPLGAADR